MGWCIAETEACIRSKKVELRKACSSDRAVANGSASSENPMNRIINWVDYRLPIFTFLRRELNEYPTPRNLNYLWNFGSLSGIVLVTMIVTGIVLAMHYTPTTAGAFDSVEHIMRDVNYG
jgi:hypothetical protein